MTLLTKTQQKALARLRKGQYRPKGTAGWELGTIGTIKALFNRGYIDVVDGGVFNLDHNDYYFLTNKGRQALKITERENRTLNRIKHPKVKTSGLSRSRVLEV